MEKASRESESERGRMKRIVMLGYSEAVDAIKGTTTVMYKHGVWNKYEPISTEKASKYIMSSGYGADVYKDENGRFYVSIPCDSDMW